MILISAAIFTVAAIAVHRKYNPESSDADNHAATIAQRDSEHQSTEIPPNPTIRHRRLPARRRFRPHFKLLSEIQSETNCSTPGHCSIQRPHANELQSAWTNHLVVAVEPTNAVA
jgi:hypothetical protein